MSFIPDEEDLEKKYLEKYYSTRSIRSIIEEDDKLNLKYFSAYRIEMKHVLENWDSKTLEQQIKVMRNYLVDLKINIFRRCESEQEYQTDFDIIQEIKSKLAVYDRQQLIQHYKALIEFHRNNSASCKLAQVRVTDGAISQNLTWKVKVAVLDCFKSQTKDATVSVLYKSLVDLPEEIFKSKAKTLDFCDAFLDLDIPEERKRLLLQKSTFESDFTIAYDDAKGSVENSKGWESFYIMKLQELAGDEYQEEEEEEEPCTTTTTTDMDALKKSLKDMESKIKGEVDNQVTLRKNPACEPRGLVKTSIDYLDALLACELRQFR